MAGSAISDSHPHPPQRTGTGWVGSSKLEPQKRHHKPLAVKQNVENDSHAFQLISFSSAVHEGLCSCSCTPVRLTWIRPYGRASLNSRPLDPCGRIGHFRFPSTYPSVHTARQVVTCWSGVQVPVTTKKQGNVAPAFGCGWTQSATAAAPARHKDRDGPRTLKPTCLEAMSFP